MPNQARVGDVALHTDRTAVRILAGASRTLVNGRPAARVGDVCYCPKHGMVTVASGSSTVLIEGKPAARIGDATSCGAVIAQGSGDTATG